MGWIKAGDEKLVPRTLIQFQRLAMRLYLVHVKVHARRSVVAVKKLNCCAPVFVAVQSAIVRTLVAKTNPPVKQ